MFAAADACTEDRLLPIAVNGTIGFGQYRPADDGELRPFAIVALEVREGSSPAPSRSSAAAHASASSGCRIGGRRTDEFRRRRSYQGYEHTDDGERDDRDAARRDRGGT